MSDSTEPVRRQFGATAAAYASSAVHAAGADLALLRAAAGLTGRERLLDLGCGPGHTALALAPGAASVTGVDVTPEMVAAAREQARRRGAANAVFEEADAAALPFAEAAFDVVVSRFAGHHFADPVAALREARRVLAPDGRLFVVDTVAPEDPALDTFCNAFEFIRDPSHARCHRASEWLRMMAAAGFEARVLHRLDLAMDGAAWVGRTATPPARVALIRELFAGATARQRAAFDIRDDDPWGFSQPVAILVGTPA